MSSKKKVLTSREAKSNLAMYVGEGKYNILGMRQIPSGGKLIWQITMEDNEGRIETMQFDSKNGRDKFIKDHKGKNNYTFAAKDKYTYLNGWTTSDLKADGFRPSHIALSVHRCKRQDLEEITLPKNCGTRRAAVPLVRRGENRDKFEFIADIRTPVELDNLIKFLKRNYSDYIYAVKKLGVVKLGKQVQLELRAKSKGGGNAMELTCYSLNDRHYSDCMRDDLYEAGEGIMENLCSVVPSNPTTKMICMFRDQV